LAGLAEQKGRRGEAARRAYLHGFGVVAKWPEERHHRLSGSPAELKILKAKLWKDATDAESAAELLAAVRGKISEFGYSGDRVLFELFQNADDAYGQLDDLLAKPAFASNLYRTDLAGCG
jgi:hypothetical protein